MAVFYEISALRPTSGVQVLGGAYPDPSWGGYMNFLVKDIGAVEKARS